MLDEFSLRSLHFCKEYNPNFLKLIIYIWHSAHWIKEGNESPV